MIPPVTHSIDGDGLGWIVFDDPTSRANIFNPSGFAALDAAIAALENAGAKAMVLISGKERIFVAGADLKWLSQLPDVAGATEVARAGQRVFQRLAESKVPVVCAIQGAAAGGGLEVALACHWRIATDDRSTQIGLPETTLGTIPGWGGCVRLSRLIGAEAALGHILAGRLISAQDALQAGIVDEVVASEDLKDRASAVAEKLCRDGPPERATWEIPPEAWFAELTRTTIAKARGASEALEQAIRVVARSAALPLDAALAIEAEAFGQVTAGETCKHLIYAFFLREAARKRTLQGWDLPRGSTDAPPPIRKVGVVGAGVMGSGIAQWCATRGHEVVLRDVKPEFVERGMDVIRGLFADSVKRGKLSTDAAQTALGRIATTTAWAGFDDCDLVIEAIVEDVAIKQKLFAELAKVTKPGAVLASNTSALPIAEIAGHVARPGRTVGIHFFNPVSRMPLVELILGPDTTADVAQPILDFVKGLGKSPVICGSSPGFLVTRVLFFYLNEACRRWEQGVPTVTIDAAMSGWGWPMGPMRLIDEVGVDVTDFIFGEMAHYFPERFTRSTICSKLVGAGLKGRKNGASSGFYAYEGRSTSLNPVVDGLMARDPAATKATTVESIQDQLMGVMVAEAQRCLDEGIIKTREDVDFALLSGAGFPAFRGGLMRWASRSR